MDVRHDLMYGRGLGKVSLFKRIGIIGLDGRLA